MGYGGNSGFSGPEIQQDSLRRLSAMTSGQNAQVAPPRLAHIPDELQRVEQQIENIAQMGEALEQRLDAVLRPSAPSNDKSMEGRPSLGVPLANALSQAHTRLTGISMRLSSLLERIEL